jgi:hypothetical protein
MLSHWRLEVAIGLTVTAAASNKRRFPCREVAWRTNDIYHDDEKGKRNHAGMLFRRL